MLTVRNRTQEPKASTFVISRISYRDWCTKFSRETLPVSWLVLLIRYADQVLPHRAISVSVHSSIKFLQESHLRDFLWRKGHDESLCDL